MLSTFEPYFRLDQDPEYRRILRRIHNARTKTVVHHETCPCCGAKLVNLYRQSVDDKMWKCRKCWEKSEAPSHLKIVEINPEFKAAVDANDGYCPCLIEQSDDTKCMCKDFREQTEPGPCHCGRFEKVMKGE